MKSPLSHESSDDSFGILGYRVKFIERVDSHTARVTFSNPHYPNAPPIITNVPAGPDPLLPFPFSGDGQFGFIRASERFIGLLTCFLQAHALGWDILFVPPVMPATASTSTGTLVRAFGEVLGYSGDSDSRSMRQVVHLYKEVGGREVVMRRRIGEGGATSWEPRWVASSIWDRLQGCAFQSWDD